MEQTLGENVQKSELFPWLCYMCYINKFNERQKSEPITQVFQTNLKMLHFCILNHHVCKYLMKCTVSRIFLMSSFTGRILQTYDVDCKHPFLSLSLSNEGKH